MKTPFLAQNPLILACLAALLAMPAQAGDPVADTGFDLAATHPGISLDEFRQTAWPDGARAICSSDSDRPDSIDPRQLLLPKGVAAMGAARCGLYQGQGDDWHLYRPQLAGQPTEIWGKFFPDRSGTPRMVQLVLKQPKQSIDALADYFDHAFGAPSLRHRHLARWNKNGADISVIEDGGDYLYAYLIDNALQSAMNARMSQHPKPH